MAYLDMADPGLFKRAVRSGHAVWYTVDAACDGVAVSGATDMRPTGGSIVDTTRPGVRRVLSMTVAATAGLYEALSPDGTELTVTAHVRLTSRTVVDVPMGVFVLDRVAETPGGGDLRITAPDKWSIIQRAKFLRPRQSTPGISVSDQIVVLIRAALGAAEVVNQVDTSTAVVGPLTWDDDCERAILDLAKGAGLWVYFDRDGVATVDDAPTIGASADWLIDASASGVLTELDRERSRERTRNVVTVSSSAADAEAFEPQTAWDNDPSSPTYAGTNPFTAPDSAGPFGIVPLFYETPLPLTWQEALWTAKTILHRVTGLASQVSLGSVPNPAADAGDAIDVLAPTPRRSVVVRYRGSNGFGFMPFGTGPFGGGTPGPPVVRTVADGASIQRHIADTITTPLVDTGSTGQRIEGRSTRTDDYE